MSDWEEEYKQECKARAIKDKKLFEEYISDPTKNLISKERDRQGKETTYEYRDWVKETEDDYKEKTITFRVSDKGNVTYAHSNITKSQKFLCVGGPLAGQKIVPADDVDYIPFNCAGWNRNGNYPSVVLVFKDLLQTKEIVK